MTTAAGHEADSGHEAESGHIEVDELADLGEGLLDRDRAAQVRAHLVDCGRCRDTAAALEAVQQQLASAPPVQMPGHVFARLQASLESEQRRREAAELRRTAGPLSGPGLPSIRDPYSNAPSYDDSKYQPERRTAHTHGPSSANDPDED